MLEAIATDLWVVNAQLRMMPGFYFPIRMTVARAPAGGISLISPVAIDDALAQRLSELGPVERLIAPNVFHHVHLASAAARYATAQVLGPRALQAKKPEVRFSEALVSGARRDWGLELVELKGAPWMNEHALLHTQSRTLIVTDLVFNMGPNEVRGALTPWVLRMVGAWDKLGTSRLLKRNVADRSQFASSLDTLLDLDFDNLVMAHGALIRGGARERLAAALSWARSEPQALVA